jgi:hypothetical protein
MRRELSFYDEDLKRELFGSYVVEKGTITAYLGGDSKSTRVGASASAPEHIVKMMMREMARKARES